MHYLASSATRSYLLLVLVSVSSLLINVQLQFLLLLISPSVEASELLTLSLLYLQLIFEARYLYEHITVISIRTITMHTSYRILFDS